jgi:alpha-L-rhamnosidase
MKKKRLLGCLLICCCLHFAGFAQTQKPNIIFILTDDHRWDALGITGNTIIRTPEMDNLASLGTYFSKAFVTTPICAASRASLLTGLYERTHGYTFQKPKLKDPYAAMLYPKILKENGYHVGFFGKLGVTLDNPKQYFSVSDIYDRGNQAERAGYFYKKIGNDTVHLTRYSGYQATQFIKEAPNDRPFCLSISFSAPHAHDNSKGQYYWQEKSDTLYQNAYIPPPLLGDTSYFTKLPLPVREGFNRTRWKWRFDTPEKYQEMVKGYFRMITEIDQEIALIRQELSKKGVEKNTIIIIMGDNGYFLGDRQLADKWLMYDYSIRVPLIIYDPRKNNPNTNENMVLNIDIPATILDAAGITIPDIYQGNSLLPYLDNKMPTSSNRKSILVEHLWTLRDIPSSEGIRTENWKYFRYRLIDAPEELYDLKNDPLETTNLARIKKYESIIKKLRKECEKQILLYQSKKLCPDDPFIENVKF